MMTYALFKKSVCFFDCGCCTQRDRTISEEDRHIKIPQDFFKIIKNNKEQIIIHLSSSQEPCAFYLDEVFEQLLCIKDKIFKIQIESALSKDNKYALQMIKAINEYQNFFNIKLDIHIFPMNFQYVKKHLSLLKDKIKNLFFHYVTDYSESEIICITEIEKLLNIKIRLKKFIPLKEKGINYITEKKRIYCN